MSASIRWGLCCHFVDSPIHFRTATHKYVSSLDGTAGRLYLTDIVASNAAALLAAVQQCHALGIGAFRINSQILPLSTHPASGYSLAQLDLDGSIAAAFTHAGNEAARLGIRLSFHPDQFVVLNSEREDVVRSSVREMEAQAEIAALVGADVINVHAGSGAGGIPDSLERLERGIDRLSVGARSLVTLENDDRQFTPAVLEPLCTRLQVPLVYDVHHHRCCPDGLSVSEATAVAVPTWRGREPHFHLSSPRTGWDGANPRPHADYIEPGDFPDEWSALRITVDVEAKAKERAVLRVMRTVQHH